MYIGIAFWGMMILWIVLSVLWRSEIPAGKLGISGNIFMFVLFFLLGWKVFGFILHS